MLDQILQMTNIPKGRSIPFIPDVGVFYAYNHLTQKWGYTRFFEEDEKERYKKFVEGCLSEFQASCPEAHGQDGP